MSGKVKNNIHVGDIFDKLKVAEILEERGPRGQIMIKCECECGNIKIISKGDLTCAHKRKIKACGCLIPTTAQKIIDVNRLVPLVDGTHIGNIKSQKLSSRNTSGVKGVYKHKGLWVARIQFKGQEIFLGCSTDKNKAIEYRKAGEEKYFKSFLKQLEEKMTPMESKITALVKQAKRNKEIADILGITEGTVRTHLRSIFRKLKIKSRAELIIKEL